eukprot:3721219-Rhodomonas_salina.1
MEFSTCITLWSLVKLAVSPYGAQYHPVQLSCYHPAEFSTCTITEISYYPTELSTTSRSTALRSALPVTLTPTPIPAKFS